MIYVLLMKFLFLIKIYSKLLRQQASRKCLFFPLSFHEDGVDFSAIAAELAHHSILINADLDSSDQHFLRKKFISFLFSALEVGN